MLLSCEATDLPAAEFVAKHEDVFAVFDAATQDSGNVSYGVRLAEERFFVKTAGEPSDRKPLLSHPDRVALLRNAVRLGRAATHEALPQLRNVIESIDGPILVYEWVEGELVGTTRARRSDPASAFARFRGLAAAEAKTALDLVFRLHAELAQRGWIACDFYDGCLIYDFAIRQLHVVDLDHYRDGPFVNTMGRMFGSTRFMAPEEHELGARIDERTTVFTMGRTIQQLFTSGDADIAEVARRACETRRERRFETLGKFYEAWSDAARIGRSGTAG